MARRSRRNPQQAAPPPLAGAFEMALPARPRPVFSLCSDEDRAAILGRAKDLLADHGVAVVHEAARGRLLAAGGRPGRAASQVCLPRAMVAEAVAAAPKRVRLCGKRPGRDVSLPRADHGFIMRTGTGAHGYVDPATGGYRNMDIADVAAIAAIGTGLDQVGFIAHPFCYGVHELTSDIHSVAELISRTDKHIWLQPYNVENVEYLMRIVGIAGGSRDRPIASTIMCSFSPLEFKVMDVEALIQSGRAGLPVHACSLPSAGGTAPLSAAGNALMAVAEVLAMVTLAHVLAPGTPVIATPLMFTLDMATGRALHSCPESLQAKALAVDVLGRAAGLVTHTYGMGSDTPDVDAQSMAERAMLGQMVALAGADILGGVGQLETATVFSPVQAVLDNELGAFLRELVRVPEISDAAFNWDETRGVGIGAHFLSSPHTLEHCRSQFRSAVFPRMGRDDYEKADRAGAFEAARDRALALIAADPPPGLPDPDAVAAIRAVAAAADADIIPKSRKVSGRREVI